jgi:hypothetical protein
VNGHAIVNRASGEEIPADEPVFIFRARDKWAAGVLGDYATFVEDPAHKAAVEERFIQFGEWAEAHPERMKEPDTQPSQPTLLNGLTEQETAASASVAGLSGAQPEAPAEPSGLVIPEECAHLIMFDDQDKKPAVFAGAGARTAALAAYERMSVSWNAHLFVCIDHNSRDQGYPVAKVATPAPVAQQQQAELSLTEIGNVWDSLKAIHGGEPCRHAHVEFARAVIKAQGGSQ